MQGGRIVDSLPEYGNQLVMIHRVKVLLNVQVYHPFTAFVQVLQHLPYRLVAVSVRSKAIAMLAEIAFIAPAQYLRHRLLDHPVHYRLYSQRSLLSICLRYVHTPYWLRLILLGSDLLLDFLSVLHKVPFQSIHRHLVDSGCTSVALYRMNRSFDVPVSQNPVNQFHLLRLLLLVKLPEIFPPPFGLHGLAFPLAGPILGFGISWPCLQRFALLRH